MNQNFISALRSVADDIEAGTLKPGRKQICNFDGSPCCAIGHVIARAKGFAIVDSYEPWYEGVDVDLNTPDDCHPFVIWEPNDSGDWPGTVAALRKVADILAARTDA